MEDLNFSSENIISVSLDFKKLSGTLNLLYQFHRSNSSSIEILQKSVIDLTTTTEDLTKSLNFLSSSIKSLELFKESSQIKQKNLETQINSIEDLQIQGYKSLEKKLPEFSNQMLTELEKVKTEQKTNLQEIKSEIRQKLKKSKSSIMQSVELSRVEATEYAVEAKLVRQNSENFELLAMRLENVENSLKRLSYEENFDNSEEIELNKRILNQIPEERSDLVAELNLKYLSVINEVAKLREMLRSFAQVPKEESLPASTNYITYSTRISELEQKIKDMDENFKDLNNKPIQYSPLLDNKRNSYSALDKGKRKVREGLKGLKELNEFQQNFVELNKKLEEKVSIVELENYIKVNIDKFLGFQESPVKDLENRIFKDLIDRSESLKSQNFRSISEENLDKPLGHAKNVLDSLSQEHPAFEDYYKDLKNLIQNMTSTISLNQATTIEEIERFSSDLKTFEAKINKFSTTLQVQDLRIQDILKRQQHSEDFQQEISNHIQKFEDRLKRNSLKSEDLEKNLIHLQELEKIRNNVQEIIHKVQEGNKLHKQDYNTIQELRKLLDSKTSKEDIDQKVDKNELKKIFRNLSSKVNNI